MSAFTKWVDGENAVPLKTDFKPVKEKKPKEKHASLGDKQRLDGFLKLYAKCAVVISVLMLIVLLIGAVALPTFAEPGNPTDNEVVHRYVGSAEEETGAADSANAIRAAMAPIRAQLQRMSPKQRQRFNADVAARMKKLTRKHPAKSARPNAYAALRRAAVIDASGRALGQKIMASRNANLRR